MNFLLNHVSDDEVVIYKLAVLTISTGLLGSVFGYYLALFI